MTGHKLSDCAPRRCGLCTEVVVVCVTMPKNHSLP
jgi:hypothetical protein